MLKPTARQEAGIAQETVLDDEYGEAGCELDFPGPVPSIVYGEAWCKRRSLGSFTSAVVVSIAEIAVAAS